MAAIWCPGLDSEMQTCINSIVAQPLWGVGPDKVYEGYMKELHMVNKDEKLYIICHGHGLMPLFVTSVRTWSAAEMAELIERDQLSKDHRVIELLVCHAGESVTSVSNAQARFRIKEKAIQLKNAGKDQELDKLKADFAKIKPDYRAFDKAPAVDRADQQVIPMSAQLVQEMKNRGYKNIRIISYGAAIAQYFAEGVVKLDLSNRGGQWGEDAAGHPSLKFTWL